MPRQIPLRRARGGGGELDGCAEIYLKGIIAIIVIILVGTFCRIAIDAIHIIAPLVLIVIGALLVAFAIENRSQIASWLVTVENQIEQWTNERFVLVVASLTIIAFCLILLAVVWGLTPLQKGQ